MPVPQMIPLEKIATGENPRGKIDESSTSFAELVSSIEDRGVLQSILVGPPNGNGKHKMIAGHRRLAAAAKLKLAEIPAMVVDAEGAELTLALIENVQREDLSPVAEARALRQLREKLGLTQVEAAATLSKSERWARERERLLNMAEEPQGAYDAGALPLESIGSVEKVAAQAPTIADAIAAAATDDEGVRRAMAADQVPEVLNHLVVEAAEDLKKDGSSKLGCLVFAGDGQRPGRVTYESLVVAGAPHAQLKKVKDKLAEWKKAVERLRRADTYAYGGRDPDPMWIEPEDADGARTFGCLLEVDGAAYITDAAWLADRFEQHVDDANQVIEKAIAEAKAAKKGSKAEKKTGTKEEEQAAKEERERDRAAEQAKRDGARANNLELGQRVARALKAPKLSLEEAKLVALLVIGRHANGLGARGLIYCFHDYQDEEVLKNGRTKVSYAKATKAGEDLLAAIKAAKKPDEAIGLALQSILLANFADQECVAPSNRSWHSIGDHSADDDVSHLLSRIAEKRSVLPDAVREAVARQQQEDEEREERDLLNAVKGSRARAGLPRGTLTETYLIDSRIIDAAVTSKWLKEHDGEEEPSYTILAAGKKRLKLLVAAEKERASK